MTYYLFFNVSSKFVFFINFFIAISRNPGDVREEIKKVGRINTGETFNRLQAQKRQYIMSQRDKGMLGALTGLNKL